MELMSDNNVLIFYQGCDNNKQNECKTKLRSVIVKLLKTKVKGKKYKNCLVRKGPLALKWQELRFVHKLAANQEVERQCGVFLVMREKCLQPKLPYPTKSFQFAFVLSEKRNRISQ